MMRLLSGVGKALHLDPYGNLRTDRTRERLIKALSPRYVLSKLALIAYEKRHPDHPWLTRTAIEMLDAHLSPAEHLGFEWGSGNGTIWLARRLKRLVSVEHAPHWHERVSAQLARAGVRNVDYRLVQESAYSDVIDAFPDETFDFILVDGLFRDEAFARSIPKTKPGGWIVFDNANWYLPSDSMTPHSRTRWDGPAPGRWRELLQKITAWELIWTTNGVNDTAIYKKPLSDAPGLRVPHRVR